MTHTLVLTQSSYPDHDLVEKIKEYGLNFVHVPALEITYSHQNLECPFTPETLIVTSKHAVENLGAYQLSKEINILCVGEKVSHALREQGFHNITGIFETGTQLVSCLEKKKGEVTNILYLRGKNVHTDIDDVCTKNQLNLHEHIAYSADFQKEEMIKVGNIIKENQIVTICIFSERGAQCLEEVLNCMDAKVVLRRTNLLCLSERMLKSLKKFEWQKMMYCTYPTRDEFVRKIYQLREREKEQKQ